MLKLLDENGSIMSVQIAMVCCKCNLHDRPRELVRMKKATELIGPCFDLPVLKHYWLLFDSTDCCDARMMENLCYRSTDLIKTYEGIRREVAIR